MAITCLKGYPAPVELDTPIISEYASAGWDLKGAANHSGMTVAGCGDQHFTKCNEICVRVERGQDKFLAEFAKKGIVVKNSTRVSLIDGLIIQLQERHQLLRTGASEVELICFGCAKYFPNSQMEADHFQPQAEILGRMKMYWTKLEVPSTFYSRQKRNPLFSKMFTWFPGEQKLKMNQFFTRGYVHSSDNIWPLCRSCNGLAGKRDTDPLTFLATKEHYGDAFINSLPPLNGRGILIRAGERNEVVAQFAINWFIDKARQQIAARQLYTEIQIKQEESVNKKLSIGDGKEVQKQLIRLQAAEEDSDGSDTELDLEIYKQAARNMRKALKAEYNKLKNDLHK